MLKRTLVEQISTCLFCFCLGWLLWFECLGKQSVLFLLNLNNMSCLMVLDGFVDPKRTWIIHLIHKNLRHPKSMKAKSLHKCPRNMLYHAVFKQKKHIQNPGRAVCCVDHLCDALSLEETLLEELRRGYACASTFFAFASGLA